MEYKLSKESAQVVLNLFLDEYEIDIDDCPEDEMEIQLDQYGRLIKQIRLGRIEIESTEKGIIVTQHLKRPPGEVQSITYNSVKGSSKSQMGNKKDTDVYGKMYAFLGSLSGLGEHAIMALSGVDLRTAESLGFLFLR